MASSAGNALTTPSVWDISRNEGSPLETSEDLFIVLKSVFPQGNVEIKKKDEYTYRIKLPYCTKLATIQTKLQEFEKAVTVLNAGADLTEDQTRRLAGLRRNMRDASGLKGLRLMVPEAVRSGEMVRLACNYDLEGAFLYSIKWYREEEEFYRYLPKEAPPTRVFPLPGVHVDVSTSDDRIVTLLNVDRRSTGTFKCEVSADAPLFHTEIQSATLRVVDVPVGEPEIAAEKLRYASGEQIQVNCTAPPSHPAVNLTWYLNNHQEEEAEYSVSTLDGLQQALSVLSLEADTGKLRLRCEATMYHLYRGVSEVELWQDSPRPASVLGPGHSGEASPPRVQRAHIFSLLSFLLLLAR